MKSFSFPIEGMTCASCVTSIEKIIGKFEGVSNVNVNLANESVTFQSNEDDVAIETSEITLVQGNLLSVAKAIKLSKQTIKQLNKICSRLSFII